MRPVLGSELQFVHLPELVDSTAFREGGEEHSTSFSIEFLYEPVEPTDGRR